MTAPVLSIASIGDLSFEGPLADAPTSTLLADVAAQFRQVHLTIANLESPLVDGGTSIPGKCSLRGTSRWAAVLKDAGIGLVSLANNHTMDYGVDGLRQTIAALEAVKLDFVGAGMDLAAANAPLFRDVNGARVAFLARTSVVVAAPTYAGEKTPGVAFLDVDDTVQCIRQCRRVADVVVLLMHWGLEEYRHPSPAQRRLAATLVEAGADVILGHHPHVTQGIERIGGALVAYSLGNFVFSAFDWEYLDERGQLVRAHSDLSATNKEGVITRVTGTRGHWNVALTHTAFDGTKVNTVSSQRRHREAEHLDASLARRHYDRWWRLYAMRREWFLRFGQVHSLGQLVRRLPQVRPRHLRQFLGLFKRSAKIVTDQSTNPYE